MAELIVPASQVGPVIFGNLIAVPKPFAGGPGNHRHLSWRRPHELLGPVRGALRPVVNFTAQ